MDEYGRCRTDSGFFSLSAFAYLKHVIFTLLLLHFGERCGRHTSTPWGGEEEWGGGGLERPLSFPQTPCRCHGDSNYDITPFGGCPLHPSCPARKQTVVISTVPVAIFGFLHYFSCFSFFHLVFFGVVAFSSPPFSLR